MEYSVERLAMINCVGVIAARSHALTLACLPTEDFETLIVVLELLLPRAMLFYD